MNGAVGSVFVRVQHRQEVIYFSVQQRGCKRRDENDAGDLGIQR